MALRACDTGDDVALAAALDARDLLTRRFAPLLRDLNKARQGLGGDPRLEQDFLRLLAPAERAAREARSLNATLEARTHDAREAIGVQLGRLSHDDSARAAYVAAGAAADAPHLDLRR
jgi:hypothetical protein